MSRARTTSRASARHQAASESSSASQQRPSRKHRARRAYRRPVTGADIEPSMELYKQTREKGGNFDSGVRVGLARMLTSPWFLYRIERDPAGVKPGTAHPVSDVELASRLSFFLWSSI